MSGRRAPRVGFVGVGWIGRHRMEAACRSGLVAPVAVADAAGEALAASSAVAPGARRYRSLEAMLEGEPELDGVVLATPSALHAEQSLQALERGVAVFCQKPLARTAAEAQRVVAAARRADRLLGVDLSYRHVEGVRRMRELIGEGALGRLFAARLVFHNAYGPDKGWFYDPGRSGGGCVIDLGTHLLDLALWVLGWPAVEGLTARCWAAGQPLERVEGVVEDYALLRLDLAGGASAEVACSWRLHAGCDAAIEIGFWGTEGGVLLRNVGGSFFDFRTELLRGTARQVLAEPPEEWGGRAIAEWARRLAADPGYEPEVERVVEVAALIDRVYGAREGAPLAAAARGQVLAAQEVVHG